MSCTCEIDGDFYGNAPTVFTEANRKARKQHVCCECFRKIESGETYRDESGMWGGEFRTYKTCADCLSVRDVYFCSWTYGEIWEDVHGLIVDSDGQSFLDARLGKVTPAARAKICEQVEQWWEENE